MSKSQSEVEGGPPNSQIQMQKNEGVKSELIENGWPPKSKSLIEEPDAAVFKSEGYANMGSESLDTSEFETEPFVLDCLKSEESGDGDDWDEEEAEVDIPLSQEYEDMQDPLETSQGSNQISELATYALSARQEEAARKQIVIVNHRGEQKLIHYSEAPEVCKSCLKVFPNFTAFYEHNPTCQNRGKVYGLRCEYCNRICKSQGKLEAHQVYCNGKPKVATCQDCQATFGTDLELAGHRVFCTEVKTTPTSTEQTQLCQNEVEVLLEEGPQFNKTGQTKRIKLTNHKETSKATNKNDLNPHPSTIHFYGCPIPNCIASFRLEEKLKIHEARCRFKYEQMQLMEKEGNKLPTISTSTNRTNEKNNDNMPRRGRPPKSKTKTIACTRCRTAFPSDEKLAKHLVLCPKIGGKGLDSHINIDNQAEQVGCSLSLFKCRNVNCLASFQILDKLHAHESRCLKYEQPRLVQTNHTVDETGVENPHTSTLCNPETLMVKVDPDGMMNFNNETESHYYNGQAEEHAFSSDHYPEPAVAENNGISNFLHNENYTCPILYCMKQFRSKELLEVHHKECQLFVVPCTMSTCYERFKTTALMFEHLKSKHSNLQCSVPNCSASFVDSQTLKAHEHECAFKYEEVRRKMGDSLRFFHQPQTTVTLTLSNTQDKRKMDKDGKIFCSVPNCSSSFRENRLDTHERRCRFKYEQLQLMKLESQN